MNETQRLLPVKRQSQDLKRGGLTPEPSYLTNCVYIKKKKKITWGRRSSVWNLTDLEAASPQN